jgi:hypothetical protein
MGQGGDLHIYGAHVLTGDLRFPYQVSRAPHVPVKPVRLIGHDQACIDLNGFNITIARSFTEFESMELVGGGSRTEAIEIKATYDNAAVVRQVRFDRVHVRLVRRCLDITGNVILSRFVDCSFADATEALIRINGGTTSWWSRCTFTEFSKGMALENTMGTAFEDCVWEAARTETPYIAMAHCRDVNIARGYFEESHDVNAPWFVYLNKENRSIKVQGTFVRPTRKARVAVVGAEGWAHDVTIEPYVLMPNGWDADPPVWIKAANAKRVTVAGLLEYKTPDGSFTRVAPVPVKSLP